MIVLSKEWRDCSQYGVHVYDLWIESVVQCWFSLTSVHLSNEDSTYALP